MGDAADAAIFGGRPRLLSKVRVQLEWLHEKSCWPEEWLQAQPLALVGSLPANIRLGAGNPSLDGAGGCRLSRTRRVRSAEKNCPYCASSDTLGIAGGKLLLRRVCV